MRLHSLSQLLKIFLSLLDSLLERLLCLLQLLLQDKQMIVKPKVYFSFFTHTLANGYSRTCSLLIYTPFDSVDRLHLSPMSSCSSSSSNIFICSFTGQFMQHQHHKQTIYVRYHNKNREYKNNLFNNSSPRVTVFRHFKQYHDACARFLLNVNNADYVEYVLGKMRTCIVVLSKMTEDGNLLKNCWINCYFSFLWAQKVFS